MKTKHYIFLLLLSFLSTFSATAQQLTGTWKSTYGELRLVQNGNKVTGDYSTVGTIKGQIINNQLFGEFTNKGRKGSFVWDLSEDGSFEGNWGWGDSTSENQKWTGTRQSTGLPTLKNSEDGLKKPGGLVLVTNTNKPKTPEELVAVLHENTPKEEDKSEPKAPVRKPKYISPSPISGKIENKLEEGNTGTGLTSDGNVRKTKYEASGDKLIACRNVKADYKASFNQLFQVTASPTIQPGVLLDYDAFQKGNLSTIKINEREPLKVTVSNGGNHSKTIEISDFNRSVDAEIKKIFPKSQLAISTNYEVKEISSLSELKISLNMTADQKSELMDKMKAESHLKAGFDIKSNKLRKYFLLKFQQVNHKAFIDTPEYIDGLAYYSNEPIPNNALLVSEIGYGRLMYFLLEYSEDLMETGLNLSHSKTTAGEVKKTKIESSRSFDLEIDNLSSSSNFKVTGLNIGMNKVFIDENKDLGALKKSIQDYINSGEEQAAVPLYYKLELARNNHPMRVVFNDEVNEKQCFLNGGKFRLSFDALYVFDQNEARGDDEIYGIGWADVYVVKKDGSKAPLKPLEGYLNTNYSSGLGRIVEIKRDNPVSLSKNNGRGINSSNRTYQLDALSYGYESLEELARNTYYRFAFTAKERDVRSDDEFTTVNSQTFNLLDKPFIDKRNASGLANKKISNEMPGILQIHGNGAHYAVSYSFSLQ